MIVMVMMILTIDYSDDENEDIDYRLYSDDENDDADGNHDDDDGIYDDKRRQ